MKVLLIAGYETTSGMCSLYILKPTLTHTFIVSLSVNCTRASPMHELTGFLVDPAGAIAERGHTDKAAKRASRVWGRSNIRSTHKRSSLPGRGCPRDPSHPPTCRRDYAYRTSSLTSSQYSSHPTRHLLCVLMIDDDYGTGTGY